jgi:SAM-dependent methyltransferase
MRTVISDQIPPPLAIRAQLRWDLVKPIIERIAPTSTIEVGTGQGAMGARIAAMTSRTYTGFELDEQSFLRAKQRIESVGGTIYNQSLAAVQPPPADLLCAFEVLEHIEDDKAALEEWRCSIVSGGNVVLSVPAHPDRFGPMDVHAGHFRRYSLSGLTSLLESARFLDVSVRLYGAPLGYALEAVRNRIDAKKMARARASGASTQDLTGASGRTFQFDRRTWMSAGATAGTLPFKYLQRVWPGGVGLVAVARRP